MNLDYFKRVLAETIERTNNIKSEADDTLDKYNRGVYSYKTARDILGKLLSQVNSRGMNVDNDKLILETLIYLIKIGSPITYNEGKDFSKAIRIWGKNIIPLINSERLTYYLMNKNRANNLLSAVTDKVTMMYIIDNDAREHKEYSNAYRNIIINGNYSDISRYIFEKIPYTIDDLKAIMDEVFPKENYNYSSKLTHTYKPIIEKIAHNDPSYIPDRLDKLMYDYRNNDGEINRNMSNSGRIIFDLMSLLDENSPIYDEYLVRLASQKKFNSDIIHRYAYSNKINEEFLKIVSYAAQYHNDRLIKDIFETVNESEHHILNEAITGG